VQTADEIILPGGTAYITDLGMTGVTDSVLGIKKEDAVRRFVTCLPQRFESAKGEPELQGVLIEIDNSTKKALSIERLIIK
jgi:calcineurin-like phosphoesterase